jgi:serine/threonine protein phosphatase PrpC
LTPNGTGAFLEAMWCGDSAILVFDHTGGLLFSNLALDDATSPFNHPSAFTEVLPDHYRGEEILYAGDIQMGAHVVLCSDGLYDAFQDAAALFRWLLENDGRFEAALHDVHTELDRHRGDDDISFVWLCPVKSEAPPTTEEAILQAVAVEQVDRAFSGRIRRLLAWLVCLFPGVCRGLLS